MHHKLSNYVLIVICAGKAFAERARRVLLSHTRSWKFPNLAFSLLLHWLLG